MVDTLIINIWSGKGNCKSTILYGLAHEILRRGFSVEIVAEDKDKYGEDEDTLLKFAVHNHKLRRLKEKTQFILTDHPLPLSIYKDESKSLNFRGLVMECFKNMNNLNFYIERDMVDREKIEGAAEEDHDLKNILVSSSIPFTSVPSRDAIPKILDCITEYRTKEKLRKEGDMDYVGIQDE